ncbi:MAG: PD-(D/E)XK nuclease family protein [Firmicutes bacterium]|nr:PD-(D/E)XK nuclease family protein [Bacillota bacterium]
METSIPKLEELLSSTEDWWEDYHHSHRSSAEKLNIFRILEVPDKEVAMCRMLADLMGNTKRHTNARRYLKMFLKDVLKLENLPEDFVSRACVDKEYPIPGTDRRIDLAIYTMDYFVPIEAKIYAVDQTSQCYDYYQYAKSWNKTQDKETFIYYLTLDGKNPSEESISKIENGKLIDRLSDTACRMISWKHDIVSWLKKIMREMDAGMERDVTEQYLEVIEEMTGLTEQEKESEILN